MKEAKREMAESPHRVLLFEDDSALANTLRMALSPSYELDISGTMMDTRELIRLRTYDAVVADLTILGDVTAQSSKGGLRLIKEMRAGLTGFPDWCRTVSIIAISGSSKTTGESPLATATSLGANAVLKKPFQPEDLMELLDSEIAGSSKRRRR